MGESVLGRGLLIRSFVYGTVLGGVAIAGSTVALSTTTGSTASVAAVVATFVVSLGLGAWAGSPPSEAPPGPSGRWLPAAAFIGLAGSFTPVMESYADLLRGPWWLFAGLVLGVAIPAYTLGMIPPDLLHWAKLAWEDETEGDREPLGALARGSMAGSTLGILLAGLIGAPLIGPGPVLVACAILLLIPIGLPQPREAGAVERVLYDGYSPFAHLVVTEVEYPGARQPERRLYLNGEEESGELVRSGAPTLGYVAAAERWLSASTPAGGRYLFLGGGAYTLPRRIAERDRRAEILVVELDPDVTRLAYRYFGLKTTHAIRTVNGDARAFLEHGGAATFDRIYVDVYGGAEELPHALVTQEAVRAMMGRLTPDGIVAVNLIGTVVGEEQRPLWSIVTTFASVFADVAVYVHLGRDYPDRQNLLLLARAATGSFPASAGGFELWPREEWPTMAGVITYHDLAPPASPPVEGALRRGALHTSRERLG